MILRKFIRYFYKFLVKHILFLRDPEQVHDFFTKVGFYLGKKTIAKKFISYCLNYSYPSLKQKLWNIEFENPVGLAAGFDKNGYLYPLMSSIGFGFAEVGTVTYLPYEGNPKPRLYRLPKSKGIIVNYGLKNMGVEKIVFRLKNYPIFIPRIISVGRSNNPSVVGVEKSIEDIFLCLQYLLNHNNIANIYEINISCPNIDNRDLFFHPKNLEKLLTKISELNISQPIFIKMPINLPWEEFKQLVEVAINFNIKALVIGNLNKDFNSKDIFDKIPENIKGAISGKPTRDLSNDLIYKTYAFYGEKIKIIGVGGIFSSYDAYEKIKRGASLVQLITGMIYEGPQLIGEINEGLVKLLHQDGFQNIEEAIGFYHKNTK